MSSIKITDVDLIEEAEIKIGGYKHTLVCLFALSITCRSKYTITNVPDNLETQVLVDIFKKLNISVSYDGDKLIIDNPKVHTPKLPEDECKLIHGSTYLLPAVLGINKEVIVYDSGGCRIGDDLTNSSRPIEHMISIMEKFGASFRIIEGVRVGTIAEYVSCDINILDYSSHKEFLAGPTVSGATKTAILCASCAKYGVTRIRMPYMKADVLELLKVMKMLGYRIDYKDDLLEIYALDIKNKASSIEYELISDVTEIITYIALSIYCNISLTLTNISMESIVEVLKPEFDYLKEMGVELFFGNDYIRVPILKVINSTRIVVTCMGIYSDSQPFFALMLLRANKTSEIVELVWKNRFHYAEEINKAGHFFDRYDNRIVINPITVAPKPQIDLYANDLRAAAVLLIFALKQAMPVTIHGIDHLDRGYNTLLDNLKRIGAKCSIFEEGNGVK